MEPDITRLIASGLVAADWNADPAHGMVTQSVVVFIVREGNPKQIATWEDLLAEGVEIVTPSALSSGGARWTILAAYGSQIAQGKSAEEAAEYVKQLSAHGAPQDKSAREALATFVGGKGDVLISYENEAITAQQQGQGIEYVIPPQSFLIENPIAVVTESAYPAQAAAFVEFLRGPEAQRIFATRGYRPVLPAVQAEFDFPVPAQLIAVDDLGGWEEIERTFFAPDTGLVAQLQPD
jgi:sulfate transport system substrate-binding protein